MALTYTNERGGSVTFGAAAPMLVTKIDGLGAAKNEVYSQKAPFQDGVSVVGTVLEARHLVIEGAILDKDAGPHRRELLRVIAPKLKGTLRYERYGATYEIGCVPEMAPIFPSNAGSPVQLFMLTFLCPSPFWVAPVTESEQMAAWLGFFQFPWQLPAEMGAQGDIRTLTNEGDVETPVVVEFNGPAVNPKVLHVDTGEFIRVKRTLLVGDKLTLDTSFGQKRVEVNGANAFHWLDLASTFWQLRVGQNVVQYTADSGQEQATVRIEWRNRYLGV